jgi:cytochrome P450
VEAYDNDATAVVTRYCDVDEVLRRPEDFEAVYGPRMEEITGGDVFVLGRPDDERYARDSANIASVMRREDLGELILPGVREHAEAIVEGARGRIDVPADLTSQVPARFVRGYFGLPEGCEDTLIEVTTDCFWYLFYDLSAETEVREKALSAAERFRSLLDDAIAAAKASPDDTTVLGRFLQLQEAGVPGNSDQEIRTNLIGLISGTIPTMSRLTSCALDALIDRPDALAKAHDAARMGAEERVGASVFEASRFAPFAPMIYRRATRDAVIAAGTPRARTIRSNTLVFAATQSAMFDVLEIPRPTEFRTDRPWRHYMLWGHGFHRCIGEHINRGVIPAMTRPLLERTGLKRAPGDEGQLTLENTPFPRHMVFVFDA